MSLSKRVPIYLAGIMVMALGITLLNKSNLGTTPLSSVPYALSKMLAGHPSLTFGVLTLLFHSLCVLLQIVAAKKVTIQMLLQLPLAFAFSALLDLFMTWMSLPDPVFWLRVLLCVAGITLSALGIVMIVNMNLMLPAPDALFRVISARLGVPLSKVKITGDITWVTLTAILSMIFLTRAGMGELGTLLSATFTGTFAIGIGTLLAMYLTGRLVGVFQRWFGVSGSDRV